MMWINLLLVVSFAFATLETSAQDNSRHRTKGKAMGGNLGANKNMDYTTDSSLAELRRQQTTFRIWTLDTYPNPQKEPIRCGRHGYRSFLCDPDGVLSPSEADDLDAKLNKICEETRCACQSCESPWFQHQNEECHGYKIAIAIIDNMNYTDPTKLDAEGQRWTEHLRERLWKFGMCGDDVIILLVASLHKIYTSVGLKAGEILTAQCITKGVKEASTHIQHAQYLTGLKDMVHLYGRVLKSQKDSLCKAEPSKPLHPAAIAVIALFSAFTVVIVIGAICCVWGTCKKGDARDTKRVKCPPDDNRTDHLAKLAYEPGVDGRNCTRLEPVQVPLKRRNSESDEDIGEGYPEDYPMNTTRELMYASAHAPPRRAEVQYRGDDAMNEQITSLSNADAHGQWKSESYNSVPR